MLHLLKQARAALALLSPHEVMQLAERPVRFGLVASDAAGYQELERFLGLATRSNSVFRASDPAVPSHIDIVLCAPEIDSLNGAFRLNRAHPEVTLAEILDRDDDLELALARQFPGFRAAVIDRIVHDTSKENALFAITTALPDVLPSLIELPWAFGEWASDTAFLTVNQIRMAFQIAAACGRDVGFRAQKAEVLSIGASAFGWRAFARELVGKIPLGGGLIPKGAIAYAGTFVMGHGLARMYHAHPGFTREQFREVYRMALEKGRAAAAKLLDRNPNSPSRLQASQTRP